MDRLARRGGHPSPKRPAQQPGGALRHAPPAAAGGRQRSRATLPPTPGGAALRSTLIPGWGQWASGRRWWGLILTVLTVLLLVLTLLAALAVTRPLLAFMPSPLVQRALAWSTWLAPFDRRVLGLLAVEQWAVIWRGASVLNAAIALVRLLIALDAAAGAGRAWRRLALAAGSAEPPVAVAGRRRNPLAAILAGVLLLVPHAGTAAAGAAIMPLLSQVLVPPARPAASPAGSTGTDTAPAEAEPGPPLWDGTSRLNVLLLGSDRRPQEMSEHPWGNSDTIILVSVDPGLQGAAMISVPRDLYLDIPGVGPEKINAAYREGGPQLAIRVVSTLLGQPIHRWASIDIETFGRLIDAIGGVVVDVERPIRDDQYPTMDYSTRRIFIPAGLQWLDGERALWYARSRHEYNDFDRAARQQRLLLAIKERARDPAMLSRLPSIAGMLASAVQTDITPREALALARSGALANFGSVRSLVLAPPDYGREIIRPDFYAIQPDVMRIRRDVAAVLSSSSTVVAAAGAASPSSPAPVPALRALPELPIGAAQGGPGSSSDASEEAGP